MWQTGQNEGVDGGSRGENAESRGEKPVRRRRTAAANWSLLPIYSSVCAENRTADRAVAASFARTDRVEECPFMAAFYGGFPTVWCASLLHGRCRPLPTAADRCQPLSTAVNRCQPLSTVAASWQGRLAGGVFRMLCEFPLRRKKNRNRTRVRALYAVSGRTPPPAGGRGAYCSVVSQRLMLSL